MTPDRDGSYWKWRKKTKFNDLESHVGMARHVQADLGTGKINMHIDVINFAITTSNILFLHYMWRQNISNISTSY